MDNAQHAAGWLQTVSLSLGVPLAAQAVGSLAWLAAPTSL